MGTIEPDMAHFAMREPYQWAATDDQSDADPGPDCDVGMTLHILGAAPAPLCKRGPINVGLQCDRHGIARSNSGIDIGAAPTRLGRGDDRAVIGLAAIELKRAETGNADRGKPRRVLPSIQVRLDRGKRGLRISRRHDSAIPQVIWPTAEGQDALGTPHLYPGHMRADAGQPGAGCAGNGCRTGRRVSALAQGERCLRQSRVPLMMIFTRADDGAFF